MSLKLIDVKIKGVSPLLMNAYPMVVIEGLQHKTREEQAEIAVYRDPETQELFVPAPALYRAFINGAGYSKGKGRASLQKPTAACVMISPERISLKTKTYNIDSRPVVIAATKGRIVRHRPRLEKWEISFNLEYDDTLLKETEVRRIVDDSGSRVGLLDFRPQKNGPFGRFNVVHWEVIE